MIDNEIQALIDTMSINHTMVDVVNQSIKLFIDMQGELFDVCDMMITNLKPGFFTSAKLKAQKMDYKIQFDALKQRTLDCRDLTGIFKLRQEALAILNKMKADYV